VTGRPTSRPRRTAQEVTSDRLGDFLDRHGGQLSGEERDLVARVRQLLETVPRHGAP
jgi:hypothetical protein